MAIIKCSECGREVSDMSFVCPSCGRDIRALKAAGCSCGNCSYGHDSDLCEHSYGPPGYPCLEYYPEDDDAIGDY